MNRKGYKRCPKCQFMRKFSGGEFCHRCEHPQVQRRMARENIPGLIAHFASLGIEVEAVEVKPGQFVVRRKNE